MRAAILCCEGSAYLHLLHNIEHAKLKYISQGVVFCGGEGFISCHHIS